MEQEEQIEEKREEPIEQESPELEEPLFAAKTVLNAERQLEASRAVSPKLPQLLSIFLIVFAVAGAGVLLWLYFNGGDSKNLLLAILVVPIVGYMVYSRLTMPKKAMLRWEEKLLKNYGCTELHLLTEFYDKALAQTLQEDGDLVTEGYSAIVELKETEHLFLLRHNAQQWYFVEKAGFTVGSADDFRAFITERIGG
ncbi:MAG: YcxB family protein [Oscillospiraceae bacterium]|nr:YcxB family protein [Oscillospiraceae bacterium]